MPAGLSLQLQEHQQAVPLVSDAGQLLDEARAWRHPLVLLIEPHSKGVQLQLLWRFQRCRQPVHNGSKMERRLTLPQRQQRTMQIDPQRAYSSRRSPCAARRRRDVGIHAGPLGQVAAGSCHSAYRHRYPFLRKPRTIGIGREVVMAPEGKRRGGPESGQGRFRGARPAGRPAGRGGGVSIGFEV